MLLLWIHSIRKATRPSKVVLEYKNELSIFLLFFLECGQSRMSDPAITNVYVKQSYSIYRNNMKLCLLIDLYIDCICYLVCIKTNSYIIRIII